MKYFAMINGERVGPYSLEELHKAGLTPETYVWCKDMADWEKAEDVAEICRFYRQRIFDLMHPSAARQESQPQGGTEMDDEEDPYKDFPLLFRNYAREAGADPTIREEEPNYSRQPTSLIPISLILMILCCPLTGCVAFYYALRSRQAWKEAHRSSQEHKELYSDNERQALSRKAYEYARLARMWGGITFCFGFFMAAIISRGILG